MKDFIFLTAAIIRKQPFIFGKVVDKYPDNANYNFKLGECYMNIPGVRRWQFPVLKRR